MPIAQHADQCSALPSLLGATPLLGGAQETWAATKNRCLGLTGARLQSVADARAGWSLQVSAGSIVSCSILLGLRQHLCPLRHPSVVVGSNKVSTSSECRGWPPCQVPVRRHMGHGWRAEAQVARLVRAWSARGVPGYWERSSALPSNVRTLPRPFAMMLVVHVP